MAKVYLFPVKMRLPTTPLRSSLAQATTWMKIKNRAYSQAEGRADLFDKQAIGTCRVSFEDGAGVTHTVSVAAGSLYEAAALVVAEFKRCGFAMANIGPATRLKIAVPPSRFVGRILWEADPPHHVQ